ncbi:MAG: hypothetical protein ABIY55_11910 [Kofleriaceae bacterium]
MGRKVRFVIFGAAASVVAVAIHALPGEALGGRPVAESSRPARVLELGAGDRSALQTEMSSMQATLRQLTRAQGALQRDLDRVTAERAAAEAARAATAEAARLELEDPAAADRAATELSERCDAKVQAEPIDPEWRRSRNEEIGAFFARGPIAGTQLKAIDCRTTLCRIEVSHHTVEDRERFIQSFSDLAGPKGTVFAHIETADDLDVVVYATRDGVELP